MKNEDVGAHDDIHQHCKREVGKEGERGRKRER